MNCINLLYVCDRNKSLTSMRLVCASTRLEPIIKASGEMILRGTCRYRGMPADTKEDRENAFKRFKKEVKEGYAINYLLDESDFIYFTWVDDGAIRT